MTSLIGEYIAKGITASDLEKELLMLIGKYNKKCNTYLLVYAGAISKQVPGVTLSMDDYYTTYDLLNRSTSETCDIYIETPGGSGEAAEEVVRFLRKKFKKVNFVISGEAKSAGTLIAMSANEIKMTESGSLGPIDAQIRIGRSGQSAYDYKEWVKEKRKEALKTGKLNPFDATMVAQISPGELNGVVNSLDFAKDLVVEWLPKYKFAEWQETESRHKKVTALMRKRRARTIVNQLINHNKWRSHGRSIKIDDLVNIGLKIYKIDDDPELANIVYRIQTVIKLLFATTNTFKIFATDQEKIFANAVPSGAQTSLPQKDAEVARVEIMCPKCGTKHQMYGKFTPKKDIDVEMKKDNLKQLPKDNKIKCSCGLEINISSLRNNLEAQIGKKIID